MHSMTKCPYNCSAPVRVCAYYDIEVKQTKLLKI